MVQIPITEDFVKHLMEQNAAMAEQISQLTKTVENLNQTIQKLQEQLNKNSKKQFQATLQRWLQKATC